MTKPAVRTTPLVILISDVPAVAVPPAPPAAAPPLPSPPRPPVASVVKRNDSTTESPPLMLTRAVPPTALPPMPPKIASPPSAFASRMRGPDCSEPELMLTTMFPPMASPADSRARVIADASIPIVPVLRILPPLSVVSETEPPNVSPPLTAFAP